MLQTYTGSAAASAVTESDLFARQRIDERHLVEAMRLMEGAFKGSRRHLQTLAEAMSYDDFRAAAFDVLDRETMERYQDIPAVWSQYVSPTLVKDFKPKRMVDLLGGRSGLELVNELAPYPERTVSKALYYLSVAKYGGLFAFSWEALINDDLGELQQLPGDLAIAARDTESRAAALLLTDGSGPNSAYFNATAWGRTYDQDTDTWSGGSSNLLAGNPALTIQALSDAIEAIKLRRDPEGRPVQVPKFMLVVPQALEVTAQRVLATREIRTTDDDTETIENNWVAGTVTLVVDPWLDVLDLGADAATTWYVVPDPGASRKALFLGHLRGHETPDLRVKADGGNMLGGGAVADTDGSFDYDDIRYRVRHVVGTTATDMIATAVSTGAGS
jgi:hypothetical protein